MTTAQKIINGLLAFGLVVVAVLASARPQEAPAPAPAAGATGGIYQALPWTFGNGIKLGDVNTNWLPTQTITAGQSQVAYTNRTGRPIIVDYGEIQQIANAGGINVASSTFRVTMFATTTTTVPASHDFTAVSASTSALVVGVWATSTTATTTNSVGTVPLGGQGTILLPADWTLITYLQRNTTLCGAVAATVCEAATSTNRGFDVKVRVRVHFDD